ncbi:unnamed protein product [Rotaria sordida]|uniref:Uncharacterized protein n=1 Tax=Rotaria sordida TaxID=392033 RepID=A0A815V3N5_9BILA|nr:unnamed protein product [Rotaria sordida]
MVLNVHNSSDKVSAFITTIQSDINKIRKQIDSCKCSKESVHLKPSIVDSNQLQQSIITKPHVVDKSSSSSITASPTTISQEFNQTEKIDHNNTIDIAQVINRPS